ncbi:MAG: hypothetical protein ACRCUE_11890 [Bosea sp. (in: a-proteobacteria)]
MISPPQMQDFLDNLRGCAIDRVLGDGLAVLKASNAMLQAGVDPSLADKDGVMPLASVRAKGQTEVARLIEQAGGRLRRQQVDPTPDC